MGEAPCREVSEWMVATTDSEKEAIVDDIAGSMEACVFTPAIAESGLAIDLGLLRIPNFMKEMRQYLNDDADLIIAGQGILSQTPRRQIKLTSLRNGNFR